MSVYLVLPRVVALGELGSVSMFFNIFRVHGDLAEDVVVSGDGVVRGEILAARARAAGRMLIFCTFVSALD